MKRRNFFIPPHHKRNHHESVNATFEARDFVCKKPNLKLFVNGDNESIAIQRIARCMYAETLATALPGILSEINGFAEKNLSPEMFETPASSTDGIKAIYNMMAPKEPRVQNIGHAHENPSDSDLRQMMRDPKYWRNHDDEFVRKIESGFRKLYA